MRAKRDKAIKDITDLDELESIIKQCKSCHVGMVDGNMPYVLGFNFGYKDKVIYLHSLAYGKKIEILKQNPNVSVEFDTDHHFFSRHEQVACSWRMAYRSVIVNGKAEFVNDYDQKLEALTILMSHYSNKEFSFNKPSVDNILIIKIPVEEIRGRSFEY